MKRYFVCPILLKSMLIVGEPISFAKTDWGKANGLIGVQPVFKTRKQALKFYSGEPIEVEEDSEG